MKNLSVLKDYVLVKFVIEDCGEKKINGLIVPGKKVEKKSVVVAVGPEVKAPVKAGDEVLFLSQGDSLCFLEDDTEYRIFPESRLMGIVR